MTIQEPATDAGNIPTMEVLPFNEDEELPTDEDDNFEGTPVAKGKYVIPKGVAAEELDGGKEKLVGECPPAVQDVLAKHDLVDVYTDFVKAIADSKETRGRFGGWKTKEFESVLNLFKDQFAEKGVKVALCRRKSGKGTFRWLEFIDTAIATDYIPQYDVGDHSGQYIETMYCKLKFPNGVAVETLDQYGQARKKLQEKIPIYVETMLKKKELLPLYENFVNELVEGGVGTLIKSWKTKKLHAIAKAYSPLFMEKNVEVFLSQKKEWVSHGNSGHNEIFRWLEFVDRDVQPNYQPQRDAEGKDDCVVM